MSSKNLSRAGHFWRKAGVQLTLWFSLVSVAGTMVLFSLLYIAVTRALVREDRETLREKVHEYTAHYDHGGLDEASKEIRAEDDAKSDEYFFVRIADAGNKTLFTESRGLMNDYETAVLEERPPAIEQIVRLPKKEDEDVLEILSARFKDGVFLQVGKSTEDRNSVLEHLQRIFAEMMIPVVLVGFSAGLFLSNRALRPVRWLERAAQTIVETGDFKARVPTRGTDDELDHLSRLFNRMLEKVENLIRGMRDALDNVAHDLRTPIMRLRNAAADALASEPDALRDREALADGLEETDQLLSSLTSLMDISEAETGTMRLRAETIDAGTLLSDIVDLYEFVAEEKGVGLTAAPAARILLHGDKTRLRQALSNLVDNAVKYTPAGGRVSLSASNEGNNVLLAVEDTGVGIPPEELPKVCDRLFRGDKSRSQKGMGLGLSLAKAIAEAHGGSLRYASREGVGSRFAIVLPKNRPSNPSSISPV